MTRSPFVQTACFVHEACAGSAWYISFGHGVHAAAFVVLEMVPAAHGWQPRSAVAVGDALTRSPFVQAVCGEHDVCPSAGWYCPMIQPTHVVLLPAFWIWPAAHCWQYSSALRPTAPEPKRPGSHASQKNAFLCSLCLPAGHTSHLSAFSFAEYCPAAHSLHRLPLTNVPGLQMPQ
jgi:hypothetical protein